MTLAELYHTMMRQPLSEQREPFYLDVENWHSIRLELEAMQREQNRKFLMRDSDYQNFLLCGREVRPLVKEETE